MGKLNSGTQILADTNVLLYLLAGQPNAKLLLDQQEVYCSFVSEIELLSSPIVKADEELRIVSLLKDTKIIGLFDSFRTIAIQLRRKYRLKLPDALIAATAIGLEIPLISADKSFKKVTGLKLVLYEPL